VGLPARSAAQAPETMNSAAAALDGMRSIGKASIPPDVNAD
jgi:hypothetical protein